MRSLRLTFSAPGRGIALSALAALGGMMLLSGCGGGSNNTTNAQIRAIDVSANGGTTSVYVNGTQIGGSQGYSNVTGYQSFGGGPASVTFSMSADSGTSYPAVSQNFLVSNYYSLVLVGRSDVTSPTDPRYPTVIAIQDAFNTSYTSQAAVRLVYAAPDAGPVDVLINGIVVATGATYKGVSSLFSQPSGNVTIQVNQTGTGTVLVPSQTLGLSSGQVYTLFVVEPTVSATPAYSIQQIDDTTG